LKSAHCIGELDALPTQPFLHKLVLGLQKFDDDQLMAMRPVRHIINKNDSGGDVEPMRRSWTCPRDRRAPARTCAAYIPTFRCRYSRRNNVTRVEI